MMMDLPRAGKYACILADPPWRYQTYSGPAVPQRAKRQHYKTMSLDDLMELPVAKIAAPDCVLFMWVTWPNLVDALHLMTAWQFTYKSGGFDWVKVCKGYDGMAMGLGKWTRLNTEPCLLATRGRPKRISASVRQTILAPRGSRHSEKPAEQYRRIEALVAGPRVELFARQRRRGWDAWGDQVPSR